MTGIIVLLITMILFFVLFYGISFILNMVLKTTWIVAYVFPIIVIMIVDKIPTTNYFTDLSASLNTLAENLMNLKFADILILGSGFLGCIFAGLTIRYLRKAGYQMF